VKFYKADQIMSSTQGRLRGLGTGAVKTVLAVRTALRNMLTAEMTRPMQMKYATGNMRKIHCFSKKNTGCQASHA
jgi:hypothetical protein